VSARAAPLAIALLAAAPAPLPSAPSERPRAAASRAEVAAAVAQIVTIRRDSEARVPRGSAFFVDSRHLLTCAHVVDHLPGDEARRLRFQDGEERWFEVLEVDREIDVALLVSAPVPFFIALGEAELPAPGEPVLLGGYPVHAEEGAAGPRLKPAHVSGVEKRRISGARRAVTTRRTIVNLKVDEIADAGQSGGPLLAEGSLLAVGIVRANMERETGGLDRGTPEGHAVAVPLLYVLPFIRREIR
jgi:trypsin-like peptidase